MAGRSQQEAIAAAAADVTKALQDGLRQLQATQSQAEANLNRTAQNLAGSLAAIASLQSESTAAGERYAYVQRLKQYVADLCDCLQVRRLCDEGLRFIACCCLNVTCRRMYRSRCVIIFACNTISF